LFRRWNPYITATIAVACYFGITIFARREAAQFIERRRESTAAIVMRFE